MPNEFTGTPAPWLFKREGLIGGHAHPMSGMPLVCADGLSPAGGHLEHFVFWKGPVAAGTADGWQLIGSAITPSFDDLTSPGVVSLAGAGSLLTAAAVMAPGMRSVVAARVRNMTPADGEIRLGLATAATDISGADASDHLTIDLDSAGAQVAVTSQASGGGAIVTPSTNTTINAQPVAGGWLTAAIVLDLNNNVQAFTSTNGGVTWRQAVEIPSTEASLPNLVGDVMSVALGVSGTGPWLVDWIAFSRSQ